MPVYKPGIPTGTVRLDVDYQNIQDNFQQLEVAYGVDHTVFSDTSGVPPGGITGMHKGIHMIPQAAPAAISGYGQLFNNTVNDGYDTDEILYFLTGGNKLMQLTSNVQPSAAANGYTFLPGGILIQWGKKGSSTASSVPVLFTTANIDFPNNCFFVTAIPIRADTSPGSDFSTAIVTSSVSKTGFTIANVGAHTMAGWYWLAIGN